MTDKPSADRRQREFSQSDLDGIDPYFFWVLRAGRPYFFLSGRQPQGQELLPVFLRLKDGVTPRDFAEGEHIKDREKRADWRAAVQVPSLFTDSSVGAEDAKYITAMVRSDYILKSFMPGPAFDPGALSATVAASPRWDPQLWEDVRDAVVSMSPGRPLDSTSLPPSKHVADKKKKLEEKTQAAGAAPAGTVVMGIIDDGIAFANERFCRFVGGNVESRVAYWWLQDGPSVPPYPAFLPPPNPVLDPVPHGCELDRGQINALLARCTKAGQVDEDLLYRQARLINFKTDGHQSAAWRISHGTHVMDIASGSDPSLARSDRPIIAVQLPIRVTADTSGGSLFPYIWNAIWYIVERAAAIPGATRSPVVINLSYGRLEGPHDGTADIELAIDLAIAVCKARRISLRVVLPAGNSHLSRTHAQINFASATSVQTLRWRILPDDKTPSFAEIWLPKRRPGVAGNRIEVTMTAPTGEYHTITETSGPVAWTGAGGSTYAEAWYYSSLLTNRRMFRFSLLPTTALDTATPLAPAGVWVIDLKNVALTPSETVHAWVQRDDSLYGFPLRGRQSFFEDFNYKRYDDAGRDIEIDDAASVVKRESTINAIATSSTLIDDAPIVAGGYLRKELVAAKYSSAGAQALPPPPRSPDAMAPSEDSRVHHGILAAGSHSGSVVAMGGTSVAAPRIARFVAGNLALGASGNRLAVRNQATADEGVLLPPPANPAPPPGGRGGAGRMNLGPVVALKRYELP